MFTSEQCGIIATALSFQRDEGCGTDAQQISVCETIEANYPGLLKEHYLDHMLQPDDN